MDINSFTNPLQVKIVRLDVVNSTNTLMRELLLKGEAAEGLMIVAERQTEGRGQLDAEWESQAGANILCSVLLSPANLNVANQTYLNMAVCLAVYDTISAFSRGVKIKWPNDVYLHKRKIAGILIENSLQGSQIKHTIVGIGINVNQKQFTHVKATSLHAETQIIYDKDDVLQELVDMLAKRYAQLQLNQFERIKADYHQHLMGIHEICTFKTASEVFDAIILGVDEDGRLMLRRQHKVERYMVKQISLL